MRRALTKRILHKWDSSIPNGLRERAEQRQSRRQFLKTASIVPAAALLVSACDTPEATSTKKIEQSILLQSPWNTFAAVQNHLFPKGSDSPSADDINATAYLKAVLELPDMDTTDKKFIHDGIGWINDISNEMHNTSFRRLNSAKKETVLKRIAASSAGENWLSLLLLYIFEALIAAPVYGGNTNKIGWQWLEHIPGFPLPPEDKRYYLLR